MENVAFYREWLPLNKKEFRILAMLADFGGEYHGNLTDMCRYFSVSPQHKNREALREAIQHLTDRHYIESSVNGRTYSLRIIPKEKEIALPREWLERVRTREYSSESVSWEAVIKLLLWLIAHTQSLLVSTERAIRTGELVGATRGDIFPHSGAGRRGRPPDHLYKRGEDQMRIDADSKRKKKKKREQSVMEAEMFRFIEKTM